MSATLALALRLGLAGLCGVALILSITRDLPTLRAVLPPLLAALILTPKLAAGNAFAWWKLLAICLLMVPVVLWPVFGRLLPALTTAAVAVWFAISLRTGSTPLIERMARALYHEPVGEDVRGYRRLWTGLWALWLGAVAAGLAVLALFWPGAVGMMVIVLLLPAAVIGLLALEYFIRRRRFHEGEFMSFTGFLRALATLRWEHLRQ